jgi:hypothetical protein
VKTDVEYKKNKKKKRGDGGTMGADRFVRWVKKELS